MRVERKGRTQEMHAEQKTNQFCCITLILWHGYEHFGYVRGCLAHRWIRGGLKRAERCLRTCCTWWQWWLKEKPRRKKKKKKRRRVSLWKRKTKRKAGNWNLKTTHRNSSGFGLTLRDSWKCHMKRGKEETKRSKIATESPLLFSVLYLLPPFLSFSFLFPLSSCSFSFLRAPSSLLFSALLCSFSSLSLFSSFSSLRASSFSFSSVLFCSFLFLLPPILTALK